MQNLNIDRDDLVTIVTALSVAKSEYERLSLDERLPEQLRSQFSYQASKAGELEDKLREEEGL